MIKASEGGGGKGIRRARNSEEFPSLFYQVQAEVPGSPIFVMKLARKSVTDGKWPFSCAVIRLPSLLPWQCPPSWGAGHCWRVWERDLLVRKGLLRAATPSEDHRGSSGVHCWLEHFWGNGEGESVHYTRFPLRFLCCFLNLIHSSSVLVMLLRLAAPRILPISFKRLPFVWPRRLAMSAREQWSTCTSTRRTPTTSWSSTLVFKWSTPARRWWPTSICPPCSFRWLASCHKLRQFILHVSGGYSSIKSSRLLSYVDSEVRTKPCFEVDRLKSRFPSIQIILRSLVWGNFHIKNITRLF